MIPTSARTSARVRRARRCHLAAPARRTLRGYAGPGFLAPPVSRRYACLQFPPPSEPFFLASQVPPCRRFSLAVMLTHHLTLSSFEIISFGVEHVREKLADPAACSPFNPANWMSSIFGARRTPETPSRHVRAARRAGRTQIARLHGVGQDSRRQRLPVEVRWRAAQRQDDVRLWWYVPVFTPQPALMRSPVRLSADGRPPACRPLLSASR